MNHARVGDAQFSRRSWMLHSLAFPLLAGAHMRREQASPSVLLVLVEHCEGRELAALPGWPEWCAQGTLLSPLREAECANPCLALLAGAESPKRLLTSTIAEAGQSLVLVGSGNSESLSELALPTQGLRISCAGLAKPQKPADSLEEVYLAALRAAGVDVASVRGPLLQRRILRRGLVSVQRDEDAHAMSALTAALECTRELSATLSVLRISPAASGQHTAGTLTRILNELALAAKGQQSVMLVCIPTPASEKKKEQARAAAFLFGPRFKAGFALRTGVTMLDIAPLAAHLLDVRLPEAQGKLVRAVLA